MSGGGLGRDASAMMPFGGMFGGGMFGGGAFGQMNMGMRSMETQLGVMHRMLVSLLACVSYVRVKCWKLTPQAGVKRWTGKSLPP